MPNLREGQMRAKHHGLRCESLAQNLGFVFLGQFIDSVWSGPKCLANSFTICIMTP